MIKVKITCLLLLLAAAATLQAQKVFSVEYENQAGWRNKEKIHLMY